VLSGASICFASRRYVADDKRVLQIAIVGVPPDGEFDGKHAAVGPTRDELPGCSLSRCRLGYSRKLVEGIGRR
jgi:hypothetical protein